MHVARRLLTTPALTFSEPEILEENDKTIICNLEIKARLIYFFFREQVVTCKVNLLVRVKIIVTAQCTVVAKHTSLTIIPYRHQL